MTKHHYITVPLPYVVYKNQAPLWLKTLAEAHDVSYDGGGMALGGDEYDHVFITRNRANAEKFATALTRKNIENYLGGPPQLKDGVPYSNDEFSKY